MTRVDLATGKRTAWKEITPAAGAGTVGLQQIMIPFAAADAYFYSYLRVLNELYVVDGVR